jgi:hypothetical protein
MHQIGCRFEFPFDFVEMKARAMCGGREQYGFDVLHSMVLNKYMIYIGMVHNTVRAADGPGVRHSPPVSCRVRAHELAAVELDWPFGGANNSEAL